MKPSTWVKAICLIPVLTCLIVVESVPVHAQTVPVRVSVKPLDLSRVPTTEEIMAAGQLGGELHPTHAFRDKTHEAKVNRSFGKAIQAWNKHAYDDAVVLFQRHVEQYPDSPWGSEAILHTGCYAQYHGRYLEAEEAFQWIMEKNKGKKHYGAKALLNKARLRLGVLRTFQDNFEEAKAIFRDLKLESEDWRHRTYAAHWIQRLARESGDMSAMRNCGSMALAYLLEKRGSESAREVLGTMPDTEQGHSMESLVTMAARHGHDLVALRVSMPDLDALTLPAIVYVKGEYRGSRGHYWVLAGVDKGGLELLEPQSSARFRQSREEFSREWGGIVLVFSDCGSLPGTRLSRQETAPLSGGCCGVPRLESNLGNTGRNTGPGCSGDQCPCGSPVWSVNMINMNMAVTDTPLWYTSPIGPAVEITLNYNSQSATAYYEPFGNKWQFNYASYLVVDPSNTVSIFMPDGRRDAYAPDGAGGYVRPYQVFNTLTKLGDNYFELRFPDDTVFVYKVPTGTISLQPFLVEIRDAHGQSIKLGYNASVQLNSITDALNRVTTLTYNAGGRVSAVTDPFGRSALFEYDTRGDLTKITDMGGYWSILSYDADIVLTGIENSRGKWQFYTEPADGIVNGSNPYPAPGGTMWQDYRITVTNPLGDSEEYHYNGYSRYSWYVSPRDYVAYESSSKNNYGSAAKTVYRHTSGIGSGEISSVEYPGGGSVAYGYDTKGNRTSVTDAHSALIRHTTTFTYNDLGRMTSVTDPKLVSTELKYAANGLDLLEIKNGLGSIFMTYNAAHDVTSVTSRLGHITKMEYNGYGQMTSSTDSRNIVTSYVYNANRQLERISRGGQTLESFTYDGVGRVRTRTDATGLTLTLDYNNLNNVVKTTYPDNKYVTYAYAGCCPRVLESVTDRSGRVTHYAYDELNRLKEVTDPAGGVTTTLYDESGNVVCLIDPNRNITSFDYDENDRLVKRTYADGKYVSYAYDTAGLLIGRTNARGIATTYSYDENDNLKTMSYADDTPGVDLDYDDYGRVIQRHDGVGLFSLSYDADSRPTAIDGPWGNDTVTFSYDAAGQTGLKTGMGIQGGQGISYQYDSLNRLTAVQVGSQTYSHVYSNASPLITGLTRPNGSTTTYQYDSLKRLKEISNLNSSATIISKYAYNYNARDLRSTESVTGISNNTPLNGTFTTYDYNEVNQVLGSSAGNRIFLYDEDGNMVQGYTPEGYTFTALYDAENRLKSISYTDATSTVNKIEYYYGAEGMLAQVKRYENSVLKNDSRYVRNGFLVLQERDVNNSVRRAYAWGLDTGGGIGALLSLSQGGQSYSYLYDGRGNVAALLDSSQTAVASYVYSAFGALLSKTGTMDQPYLFSTKEYSEKTGLYYYGYRFYSPILGRWTTRDPIQEAGGINLYGFLGNNPVNLLDPFGLLTEDDCAALKKLIEYEKEHGKLGTVMGRYNPLSPRLPELNTNYDSIYGPVDVDWMLRVSGFGAASVPAAGNYQAIHHYVVGKIFWNTVRGILGNKLYGGPYRWEYGSLMETGNRAAPVVVTKWLQGKHDLEYIFGPSLKECDKLCPCAQ